MRSRRFVRAGLVSALLLAAGHPVSAQQSVGSAFTYQGQLSSSGLPLSGAVDLQFKLFDSAVGGNQVGSTFAAANVALS